MSKPMMNKKNRALVRKTIQEYEHLMAKLLLEAWNAKTPHFSGTGPHRYDGNSKFCGYCNRPKDWKPVNPGVAAGEIVYEEIA